MKKTLITLTTASVVGFSSVLMTDYVQAEELEEIRSELSDAEDQVADVLIELEEINKEIEQTQEALTINKEKMQETEEEIAITEEEIAKLEEEIEELEEAIEERYDILKERAVSYQKNGGNIGFLEVIFGSKSFGDFINRVSAVTKITDSDAALMEKQEADKAEVETKQEDIQKKLEELEAKKIEIEGMQDVILEQKEQNETKKEELKEKENNLNNLIEELEMEESNLVALEQQVQSSIVDEPSSTSESNVKQLSNESPASGSGNLSAAINAGYKYTGGNSRYVYGGGRTASDIRNGFFDCSGFVSWAYSQAGYSLPAQTGALANVGSQVSPSNMQPGDLVFFNTNGTNGHVGIYVGGGKFIGSQSSTGVAVERMDSGYWAGQFSGLVRRVN
ncbi:C40 family peptidase [Oceanobacillus halotolerans]|uniref:C40 family peptidase n=1 Tax=Oceanobacillus halotolerans TaxID=2663380 RepID=UPI001CF7B5B5|nr:C40 family peptidase [Oceanobacillus halotolerans]